MISYTIRKRNAPIATLFKQYADKKSGKVSESRREIQRRFFLIAYIKDHLDMFTGPRDYYFICLRMVEESQELDTLVTKKNIVKNLVDTFDLGFDGTPF